MIETENFYRVWDLGELTNLCTCVCLNVYVCVYVRDICRNSVKCLYINKPLFCRIETV